jgi:hypothetical protein
MNKKATEYNKTAERELKVQAAIEGVRLGKYKNVTQAAKALGIPRSTVYHRVDGRKSRTDAHEHQQRLTRNQKSALCSWIKELAANGYPPRHTQVYQMAEEIRRHDIANLIDEEDIMRINVFALGRDWVRKRFLPRHPNLASVTSSAIDSNRVKDTTVESLQAWFDAFQKVVKKYGIEDENIYNMDESGFSIGTIEAIRVITSAADRRKWQAQPGRQEWVSVVECIGADGSAIALLVIFKGQSLSSSWIPDNIPVDWQFSATAKGWTSNIHGVEWLKRCFDPATCSKANGKRRLLICDGHGSHVTGNFIVYCMYANIVLLILPPHTSHLTQPLDVSIFGPLKTHLNAELHGLISSEIARVQKFEWLTAYVAARHRAFSIANILSSFSSAGLLPFQPRKVIRQLLSASNTQTLRPYDYRESTPDPELEQSPLENLQLTSSPVDISPFRSANQEVTRLLQQNPSVPQEVLRHVSLLTHTTEKLHTKSVIKQKENSALKEVLAKRQRKGIGKRAILTDVHCLTVSQLAAQIIRKDRENAAKAAAKRKPSKKTATAALNPAPSTTTTEPAIIASIDPSIDPSLSLMLDSDPSDSNS